MRCVLFQGVVNTVFVIIIYVVKDQPAEMGFMESDYMVQDFPAATSDPPFGNAVLPGCLRARLLGLQPCCLQERHNLNVEFRIPSEDRIPIRTRFRKRLAQLLHDPVRRRVTLTLKCRILRRPCSITKKQ